MDEKRIERLASSVGKVAIRSEFTVIRTLQLKREGATRDSLENARRIQAAGYELLYGEFTFNKSMATWSVEASFKRSSDGDVAMHIFTGFSFGYGGEGPRGMYDFLNMFGMHPDKDKILDHGAFAHMDKGTINLKELT